MSKPQAFYNEIDPFAAAWLRELIAVDLIASGVVDERPIQSLTPDDLDGFTQCHFFAGIGVWSYALRQAGWSDDGPVWTGSCPCQPFSVAGKRKGAKDERHLWPYWNGLIQVCRPPVIFGEQVASALEWIDLVQDDLEGTGYAVAPFDLGAASVGAPHIRQRLYFVADACGERCDGQSVRLWAEETERLSPRVPKVVGRSTVGKLADTNGGQPGDRELQRGRRHLQRSQDAAVDIGVGDADDPRSQGRRVLSECAGERATGPTGVAGFWADCDWLPCRDGKLRPVEPGTRPLAHGAPCRVGRLRGYGNALVAPLAQTFVEAYMEIRGMR